MTAGWGLGLAGMVAGLAVATAACGQPAATPTAPSAKCRIDPNPLAGVRPRHELKKVRRIVAVDRLLAGPRGDVLALGDSIFERWPAESLAAAFPGERVLNAGVAGDRTADLLFRLSGRTTTLPDASAVGVSHWRGQSPRLVTIMIGTNDLRGATPCAIAAGIVAVAAKARALYPKARVVVLGILPRGDPQGQYAAEIGAVNAAVEREARRSARFDYLDLTPAFRCPAAGACDLAIPRNYVHPSDRGYARLAAALRARLARP